MGWLIPDVAPEIVERGAVGPAAEAPEARGRRIHLRALGGVDGRGVALDQAVVDVHVGGARRHPDAGGADVTVGDVNLAAVLGAHRVAVEFEIAIVDVQEALALAHDRLMPTLDGGARDGGIAQPPACGAVFADAEPVARAATPAISWSARTTRSSPVSFIRTVKVRLCSSAATTSTAAFRSRADRAQLISPSP